MPERDPTTGRMRSSGRSIALAALDGFLARETTLAALRAGFEEAVTNDAVTFFHKIVMPLIPNAMLGVDQEGDAAEKAERIRAAVAKMEAASVELNSVLAENATPAPASIPINTPAFLANANSSSASA